VGAVAHLPHNFLRRVPGMDVALGVTAYQLGSSVEAAAAAASRGALVMGDVAQRARRLQAQMVNGAEELESAGAGLARHAVQDAIRSWGGVTGDAGQLVRGAVLGVLSSLRLNSENVLEAITGTVYGAVLGAGEIGADVYQTAMQSIAAAREASRRLGLPEQEASEQAARAALEAAEQVDAQAAERLRESLEQPPAPEER
jgi:hypothetical protein